MQKALCSRSVTFWSGATLNPLFKIISRRRNAVVLFFADFWTFVCFFSLQRPTSNRSRVTTYRCQDLLPVASSNNTNTRIVASATTIQEDALCHRRIEQPGGITHGMQPCSCCILRTLPPPSPLSNSNVSRNERQEDHVVFLQQRAAQEELEASEHRVHVMAADIASLQTKLAEQADVIRHGRALADKVRFAARNLRKRRTGVIWKHKNCVWGVTCGVRSVYTFRPRWSRLPPQQCKPCLLEWSRKAYVLQGFKCKGIPDVFKYML